MSSALVKLEQIERMLAEITTVEAAKDLRDRAAAVHHYAKTAKLSLTVQNHCAYIKLLAERRAGELLQQMAEHGEREGQGGDRRSNSHDPSLKTLPDLGITWDQSSRWQRLTKVTVEQLAEAWDRCDTTDRELTFNFVAMSWRAAMRPEEPADEWADQDTERARAALCDAALALIRMANRVAFAPDSEYGSSLKGIVYDRRELLVGVVPTVENVRDAFVAARDRLNWGIAALECRMNDPTTPLSFDEKGHILYSDEGEPLLTVVRWPRGEAEQARAAALLKEIGVEPEC